VNQLCGAASSGQLLVIQYCPANFALENCFMKTFIMLCVVAAVGLCGCKKKESTAPVGAEKSAPVTSQLKIKIGPNGEIFANNKQLSQEEFMQELQRVKQSNGGIVYTRDNPLGDTTAAQMAVVETIQQSGIPLEYSRQ
jgi:biopolymer transport protein ExbD